MGRPKKVPVAEQTQPKVEVRVQQLNCNTITVPIVGKTPLLMDRMSEETMENILKKQTGEAKSGSKKLRDLDKEVKLAIHKTSTGKVGFPAAGFKRGMIESASFVGDKFFSKKLVSGGVRILNGEEGLIPIKYSKMDVFQHNIGHNVKFSPQFHDWSCELVIQYDANNISAQDIVNLLNYAGMYIGVGSFRPHCSQGGSGEFGSYSVRETTKMEG